MRSPDLDVTVRTTLDVLWPSDDGPRTAYVAIPHRRDVRLLIPREAGVPVASLMRGYRAGNTARHRLRARVTSVAARYGTLRLLPSLALVHTDSTDGLAAVLQQVLGEQRLTYGISFGPPRANRKPVIQVLDAHGDQVVFVKLGVNELTDGRVRDERQALETVATLGLSSVQAPGLVTGGSYRGHEYLVMQPVPTWSDIDPSSVNRQHAMRELCITGQHPAEELARTPWWSHLLDDLSRSPGGTDSDELRRLARSLEQVAACDAVTMGPAHGDWTPWNTAQVGSRVVLWDWERFHPRVPRGWDAIHFEVEDLVRTRGVHPREALRQVAQRMAQLVDDPWGQPADGRLLLALYLLRTGERYISDAQLRAGKGKGPLSDWLLPELACTVASLTAARPRSR